MNFFVINLSVSSLLPKNLKESVVDEIHKVNVFYLSMLGGKWLLSYAFVLHVCSLLQSCPACQSTNCA